MSTDNKNTTFIEVCAGAGGMSTGLIHSGMTPILLNEIDKHCCNTLKMNHPGVLIIEKDMRKINLSKYKGKVDLLAGGIPCQSFSVSGKREGLDDKERGGLMLEFKRLLNQVEPKVFVIENVEGLISHNKGNTLLTILNSLNENKKYNIKYKLLNANDYEVAQKRKRVFIVGVRSDISKEFIYPSPITPKKILKDVLTNVPESLGQSYTAKKLKIMKLIPPGGCWINLSEELQKEYLGKSYESGGGKRGIARRLSMNEPCLTLTTSPSQKQTERGHPIEDRPLNVREYARIQSFDDKYKFAGSVNQQYKQIGNAVPVRLSYHIGLSIKSVLS